MRLSNILDIDMLQVNKNEYDLAVFSSGYEQRCNHIPKKINREHVKKCIVLGFEQLKDDPQRKKNDSYFSKTWPGQYIKINAHEQEPLYKILRTMPKQDKNSTLRILVDYSSMSRLWYAGILNWARHSTCSEKIEIDFLYSIGAYKKSQGPMEIEALLAIPGCDGQGAHLSKSVVIFGLGFDELATLCVMDQLEPDIIYTYLASPGAFKSYVNKAYKINKEIIDKSKKTLELPIRSVERTFGYLAELIALHKEKADITLVPMGPKPHVLSAILLAMHFSNIVCIRVSGKRQDQPQLAKAKGEIVATRVTFIADE